jgi:hypothetical protein
VYGELSANSLVPAGVGVVHREQAGWYVDAGTYRIWVGRSSREVSVVEDVTVSGDVRLDP